MPNKTNAKLSLHQPYLNRKKGMHGIKTFLTGPVVLLLILILILFWSNKEHGSKQEKDSTVLQIPEKIRLLSGRPVWFSIAVWASQNGRLHIFPAITLNLTKVNPKLHDKTIRVTYALLAKNGTLHVNPASVPIVTPPFYDCISKYVMDEQDFAYYRTSKARENEIRVAYQKDHAKFQPLKKSPAGNVHHQILQVLFAQSS